MTRSGNAPDSPKNNQWLILAASLLYTTVASYFAMNRDDGKSVLESIKANTEAISQVRERVRAVEVMLDGLERREAR